MAGSTLCAGRCVDVASDAANCGGCGNACGPGTTCAASLCVPTCPGGQARCGDLCVSLASDDANCGSCGHACPAFGVCAAGACAAVTCRGEFGLPAQPDMIGPRPLGVAAIDVDGDGLADLITSDAIGKTIQVLHNEGNRRFGPPRVYPTGFEAPSGFVVGDVSGDGVPDILTLSAGQLRLLVGSSDGTFGAPSLPVSVRGGVGITSLAVGDLNRDGREDVVAATGSAVSVRLSVPAGIGSETVLDGAPDGFFDPWLVALGDVDGDGLVDIVAGDRQFSKVGVYRNLGSGNFGAPVTTTLTSQVETIAVGDVDGDGLPEVVVGTSYPVRGIAVLRNAAGSFAEPEYVDLGIFTFSLALADVDGDGSLDVIAGNFLEDRALLVLRNHGDGTFPAAERYFDIRPDSFALADFDGDGHRDLAVASSAGLAIHLLWNDRHGRFVQPPLSPATLATSQLVAADLDGDGTLDVAALDFAAEKVALFPGAGDGTFGPARTLDMPGGPFGLAARDLDGDGLADLLVLRGLNSSTREVVAFRNGRDGSFASSQVVSVGFSTAFSVADLDGDGRPDLIAAPSNRLVFFPGAGDGTFATARQIAENASGVSASAIAAADLDGDGWIDVVYLTGGGQLWVARNQGGGAFETPVSHAALSSEQIAIGDLDGDGRPDIALAGTVFLTDQDAIGVLLNRGGGTFGALKMAPLPELFHARQVAIASVPGRARGVVLARGELSGAVAVLAVADDGTLGIVRRFATLGAPAPFAVGDVDGDLRPDVVAATTGGITTLQSTCLP